MQIVIVSAPWGARTWAGNTSEHTCFLPWESANSQSCWFWPSSPSPARWTHFTADTCQRRAPPPTPAAPAPPRQSQQSLARWAGTDQSATLRRGLQPSGKLVGSGKLPLQDSSALICGAHADGCLTPCLGDTGPTPEHRTSAALELPSPAHGCGRAVHAGRQGAPTCGREDRADCTWRPGAPVHLAPRGGDGTPRDWRFGERRAPASPASCPRA